jgi:hypothetical protein
MQFASIMAKMGTSRRLKNTAAITAVVAQNALKKGGAL